MSRKIYILTSGAYSDYGIDAVYDDKELAEKAANAVGSDVEEWDINPLEPEIRKGYVAFEIEMTRDGVAVRIERVNSAFGILRNKDYAISVFDGCFSQRILARDEEHAVKIANETRVRLIAENKL